MATAASQSGRLYDKIPRRSHIHKILDVTTLLLLTSLLVYRLLFLNEYGFAWLLAFLCESWFTFVWLLVVNTKWNAVAYRTHPDRLCQRKEELPSVDMFVTTADPVLEPPILTVNTVLSLLAVDYPADKLACYVSDDGCSALTYYSLVQASKFAELWIPFCKKHNIQVRAPFRFFSSEEYKPLEFQQESRKMKDKYEELSRKIGIAAQNPFSLDLSGELADFTNVERRNHPTIVKVIWENKEASAEGLPHLIYISREKLPKHPHHYKAGAMNVLTRVSGVLTNAPFMLNVDCDMFANNPQIVRHAMCFFLGSKNERDSGYVQSPQVFYDGFGDGLVILQEYLGRGVVGLQGPFYAGTGCFHRRKVIYGSCPDEISNEAKNLTPISGNLAEKELHEVFGESPAFVKSAADALKEKTRSVKNLSDLVEAAHQVAGCGYEYGTGWGSEVGWQYGSTTEDLLTGLMIQSRGWRSVYCTPDPPAFLGCSPPGGPAAMIQQKRWSTGLLEVLLSKWSPIISSLTSKLQFRQSLAYTYICTWACRSVPELCYALLPAYCIITNSHFLPKVQEPAMYIPVALLLTYNFYTLLEFLQTGFSINSWWINQKMGRIFSINAWLFGLLDVIFKVLGISETVFEVTRKDQSDGDNDDEGFTFDGSPIFVPGTTLLLVHVGALVMRLLRFQPLNNEGPGSGLGELVASVLVIICFWPFFKGLFGRGKYGIPLPTICKAAVLGLIFVHLSKRYSSVG